MWIEHSIDTKFNSKLFGVQYESWTRAGIQLNIKDKENNNKKTTNRETPSTIGQMAATANGADDESNQQKSLQ